MTSRSETVWRSAYKGRRVLVTGHTGFKGAWLSMWLKMLGAHVSGFALAPDSGQRVLFDAIDPERTFDQSVFHDITDIAAVRGLFSDFAPEVVFHLAAQPLVRASYQDPVGTFRTNVMGTAHVLESARQQSTVRAVVNVTSDKCYENCEQIWPYRETDPMGGHDPYSASKGASEVITASYTRAFFDVEGRVRCATARAGNVIGGGDFSADRLFPDLARAMATSEPLTVRNPSSVRPWQHVLEPLSGYLVLGAALLDGPEDYSGGWNFGPRPEESLSVEAILQVAMQYAGVRWPGVDQGDGGGPHEGSLLSLDVTKAREELGWRPVLSIEERLRFTMDWYTAHLNGDSDLGGLTARQIADFTVILDREQS